MTRNSSFQTYILRLPASSQNRGGVKCNLAGPEVRTSYRSACAVPCNCNKRAAVRVPSQQWLPCLKCNANLLEISLDITLHNCLFFQFFCHIIDFVAFSNRFAASKRWLIISERTAPCVSTNEKITEAAAVRCGRCVVVCVCFTSE